MGLLTTSGEGGRIERRRLLRVVRPTQIGHDPAAAIHRSHHDDPGDQAQTDDAEAMLGAGEAGPPLITLSSTIASGREGAGK